MSRNLIFLALACTLPQLSAAQTKDNDGLIEMSIYFGGGSYYINDYELQKLDDFLQSVEHIEYYEVGVFSHTDSIGGVSFNRWLSKMRSRAVIAVLQQRNIPKEIIKTKDWGLTKPLYTNQTLQGRQGNRRVDIVLWPITF